LSLEEQVQDPRVNRSRYRILIFLRSRYRIFTLLMRRHSILIFFRSRILICILEEHVQDPHILD
jgi:hypothetical protein